MDLAQQLLNALFDALLAPWGYAWPLLDIGLWATASGVFALWVYRRVSNQKGIARAKERIKMRLIEVRLWRDEPRIVMRALGGILTRNGQYFGYSLVPMVVMALPFMAVLFQLVAHFAFVPHALGETVLVHAKLEKGWAPTEAQLALGSGLVEDAPPVRTADGRVLWRLKATRAGVHRLTLTLGDKSVDKKVVVGAAPTKVPVLRTKGWTSWLYPGEPRISADSPFVAVKLDTPRRSFPGMPPGELGVSGWYVVLSLLAGLLLKGKMGVQI